MSQLTLHPLLRYSQYDIVPGHCSAILWDLREAPSTVRHVSALNVPVAATELSQNATSPSVTSLHISCGIFPEDWRIKARNPQGVTILDVLQAIYMCLQTQLRHEEWDHMSLKHRNRVSAIFDTRWRVSIDPINTRAYGVLKVDCLLQHTWFAGLSVSFEGGDSCILTLRRPR